MLGKSRRKGAESVADCDKAAAREIADNYSTCGGLKPEEAGRFTHSTSCYPSNNDEVCGTNDASSNPEKTENFSVKLRL